MNTNKRARTIRSAKPLTQDRIEDLDKAGWVFRLSERNRDGEYLSHFVRRHTPKPLPPSARVQSEPFQP
jgi:hypothetical protein